MKTFRFFLTPDRHVDLQAAKVERHHVDKEMLLPSVRVTDDKGEFVGVFMAEAVVGWCVIKSEAVAASK